MKQHKAVGWLNKELPKLVERGLLSSGQSANIQRYYAEVNARGKISGAFGIISVFGFVFVGLGIILLFAYNWDAFSVNQRLMMAFVPLIASGILLLWANSHQSLNSSLREGLSAVNILSTGAAIALVSQVFHLPGDVDRFLLVWMILSLPMIYSMQSTLVAVLYLAGITWWAAASQISGGQALLFWPLVLCMIPFYIMIFQEERAGNRSSWLSIALCLSLTIGIGTSLEKIIPGLWTMVYSAFFVMMYLIGKFYADESEGVLNRPFRNFGILGVLITSYVMTFPYVWQSIGFDHMRSGGRYHDVGGYADIAVLLVIIASSVPIMLKVFKERDYYRITLAALPLLSILAFVFCSHSQYVFAATWLFNAYLMCFGIVHLLKGVESKRLSLTNAGILIIGLVTLTRFVDSSFGILIRSIVFIVLGLSFIFFNQYFSAKFSRKQS